MAQAESVTIPKRWPLVIQPENRGDDTGKDSKLVNAYVERNEVTGETWIYKRPGLGQLGTAQTGVGRGVYNWLGDIYSIFGATLYKNGVAVTGVLDTTNGVYRFSQSLGATPRLQLGNGVASYNYDDAAGLVQIATSATVSAPAFVQGITYTIVATGTTDFTLMGAANSLPGTVFTATNLGTAYATTFVVGLTYTITYVGNTDWVFIGAANNVLGTTFVATGVGAGTGIATAAGTGTGTASTTSNFPSVAVKGWAYLDGTTYVMTPDASIRGCATINDTVDWTDTLNRLSAQIEADAGIFLAKQLVYVIATGQWSTEVFYDAINPTASPLGPVQGAKINYGCVNGDSMQELDGVLFWIATNRSSSAQVVMLNQLKAEIVSTQAVERLLGNADYTQIYSFSMKYEGHKFYGFTIVSKNVTMVYDITAKEWSQWTDVNGDYWPIVSTTYTTNGGRILQHATNGKLYSCDSDNTGDDGVPISVEIYTPNFDAGTRRRKHLNMIEFVADQTPGSVLEVRSNDWDYDSTKWTNFRRVDLNQRKPLLTNNGTFMRRAYHIQHRAATKFRIQALELQMDLGTL